MQPAADDHHVIGGARLRIVPEVVRILKCVFHFSPVRVASSLRLL
jgi:hypothetical protein